MLIETHFPYVPTYWGRWKKVKSMLIYDKYYRLGGIKKKLDLKLKKQELAVIGQKKDLLWMKI